MNDLSTPVKNIFSKAALRMLNACAKFAYNLAQGFGIQFLRKGGSLAIGIDKEALSNWIKSISLRLQENAIDSDIPAHELAQQAPSSITIDVFPLTEETGENEVMKIVRIGKSQRAAREDHTHTIPASTALPKKDAGKGGSGHWVEENGEMVVSGDRRVALANHWHPLNIGITADTYAAGNHTHPILEQRIANLEKSGAGGGGGSGADPEEFAELQTTVREHSEKLTEINTELNAKDETLEDHETRISTNATDIETLDGDLLELAKNMAEWALMCAQMLSDFYETTPTPIPGEDGFPTDVTEGKVQIPLALQESAAENLQSEGEASVGSSKKLVFSDHVHPEKGVTAPAGSSKIASGLAEGDGLAGGGHTFGKSSDIGIEILIATRAADAGDGDGMNGNVYFRRCRISGDGRIYAIGAEECAFGFVKAM